jgi:predicted small lipoprotein YifL
MTRHFRSLCVALVLFGILGVGVHQRLYAAPPQKNTAQTDDKKTTQGNPSTKVWVNTKSHVYHCPGTRYYGNTKNGGYMTQADAQKKGNRPAYGKYCG